MTEAHTLVIEDQEVEPLLAGKEGGHDSSKLPPTSSTLPPQEGRAEVPPSVPPMTEQPQPGGQP